jgi:hypothetical protein
LTAGVTRPEFVGREPTALVVVIHSVPVEVDRVVNHVTVIVVSVLVNHPVLDPADVPRMALERLPIEPVFRVEVRSLHHDRVPRRLPRFEVIKAEATQVFDGIQAVLPAPAVE